MSKVKLIRILFVILLFGDIIFSFAQYYNTPLYGDIQGSVIPEKDVQETFEDPFGFNAISTGKRHKNPNRFFAQYFFTIYFQNVPKWLQNYVSPITSVYFASAIAKIIVQILFILILSVFINNVSNPLKTDFLLAAIIVTPLFQVYGYWSRMGIVDQSVAYTFFYAVPLVVLMLFLLPIFNSIFFNKRFRAINYIFLSPFVVILPFSGPLVPAIILLIAFLLAVNYGISYRNSNLKTLLYSIPIPVYILLIPVSLWSFYSILLGLFYDSNYQEAAISLIERFNRLPRGIFSQIFHSLGFPMLLVIIALNVYLIKKQKFSEAHKMISILKWIGIFALIYVLLLPFGGYRPYRPDIIRYDTFMPVNVSLMFFFGMTTFFLIQHLQGDLKRIYSAFIIIVLLIYTFSDYKGIGKNKCERAAFEKMAISKDSVVVIPKDCFIMSWENNFDYKQSEKRAEVIQFWGITDKKILFYNKQ